MGIRYYRRKLTLGHRRDVARENFRRASACIGHDCTGPYRCGQQAGEATCSEVAEATVIFRTPVPRRERLQPSTCECGEIFFYICANLRAVAGNTRPKFPKSTQGGRKLGQPSPRREKMRNPKGASIPQRRALSCTRACPPRSSPLLDRECVKLYTVSWWLLSKADDQQH